MKTCILHVGMPKTGTTSIQNSLYHGLEDPRFRYVSLGQVNSAICLITLFRDHPETAWPFRHRRDWKAKVERTRRNYDRRLRRALRSSVAGGRTPVLSAECCWNYSEGELGRMRDFLASEGFRPRVIAYVRPIKSWMESMFQQSVKSGRWEIDDILSTVLGEPGGHRPSLRLATFERIFGSESIVVRPFVRSALHEGCVVSDFCRVSGVTLGSPGILRSNEALSADAVRLLCAYNRYFPARTTWPELLIRRLEGLAGDPLRFHSDLIAVHREVIASETASMRERYGIDISEDLTAHDCDCCIREPDDLLRYPDAALRWLAEASSSAPIAGGQGQEIARRVAEQVARIEDRLPVGLRAARILERARIRLRWIRRGD